MAIDFLKAVRGFLPTVRSIPTSRAEVEARIASLAVEERDVQRIPPDRDAAIAWLRRSRQAQADRYSQRLGDWYFSSTAKAAVFGEHYARDANADLLALPQTSPPSYTISPTSDPVYGGPPASLAALNFFLGEAIDAAIPAIIDRCFPETANGISDAERAKRLARIRDEVAACEAALADLETAVAELKRASA